MSDWVLILGCSTGHGGATAKRLSKDGYGIIGFHFDRGDVKKDAELLNKRFPAIIMVKFIFGISMQLLLKQWINTYLK